MTNKQNKRPRGRPKKKPLEIPEFKNDIDVREFLQFQSMKLTLELIEIATKKNNIKNPAIARAKQTQYKTALEGIRTTDSILKNKQIDDIQATVKRMESNIIAMELSNSNIDVVSDTVSELTELNKELETLKEKV